MSVEIGGVLRGTLRDLRQSRWSLCGAYVAYRVAAFAVLVPLAGLTLQAFLALSGREVAADEDILLFAQSPVGALGLFLGAVLAVGVQALEQACLITIGFGAACGRRVSVGHALVASARRGLPVLLAVANMLVRVLLMSAPFLAVCALVHDRLLGEFDINYYLATRPTGFRTAARIVGAALAATTLVVVARASDWLLVVPLVLFENASPWRALAISRRRLRESRWRTRAVLIVWAAAGLLASTLVGALVRGVGRAVTPRLHDRPDMLVLFIGALAVAWGLATLAVLLFNTASLALLSARIYASTRAAEPAGLALHEALRPTASGSGTRLSRGKLLAGLAAAAAVSGAVGAFLLEDIDAEDSDIAVIAHRGASRVAPENSLAAVERALQAGADRIEIDVQRTADGEVVVLHDADLMRMAGVNLRVVDATLAELRQVDIGSSFAPEFAGERLPTLREVLQACKGRAGVTIELKYYGPDRGLAERVVAIVEEVGAESEIEIMSLKPYGLDLVEALRPTWRCGLLAAARIGRLERVPRDFLALQQRIPTPAFLNAAHARGMDVYVWTPNDLSHMVRAIRMGVDGLITDEPELARAALRQWSELDEVEHLLLRIGLWLDIAPHEPSPGPHDPSQEIQ